MQVGMRRGPRVPARCAESGLSRRHRATSANKESMLRVRSGSGRPVCLAVAGTGDGSTEWLTTESPCFGIAADHPLDALSFRLDKQPEQVVATDSLGGPTFVRLPPLRAGTHLLTVEAQRSLALSDAVTTPPAKGFAILAVREPEPWTPGVASHPGLIVTSDPFDASLDLL